MAETRLILTCGLPGAGKTTLARQISADRPAARLTKDEWLIALGSNPWDEAVQARVERELWRHAQELLRLGVSVVLDFGLWTRAERDRLRGAARDLGVGVELHFLPLPLEELWHRVEARNASEPWLHHPISRPHLDDWARRFEPPAAGELAQFDAPPMAS